ncbi:MAG: class I SAM-dependent methyltransferase [Syntrophorhabdaceae bacterium]|nr:class I SAM-dependent methyltransferase [Syntrophorhabdaceae bacterium]
MKKMRRTFKRFVPFLSVFILLLLASTLIFAAKDYVPSEGQAGKDVIWLPTAQALVEKMLDMAKVTPDDYVIDLGSGDGRTVITAAKRGARALGIEYNPDLVEYSRRLADKEGVSKLAKFVQGDLFEANFSQATVITMFLLPDINLRLRPKILNLKPGTRVVSNTFDMGEWKPDQTETVDESKGCQTYCRAYLWIVPATVEGTWVLPHGELSFKQTFQMVTGSLKAEGKEVPVEGKVTGYNVEFTAGGTRYAGKVMGNTIEGTYTRGDNKGTFRALKK